MSRIVRNSASLVDRIRPLEGVGIVLLSLATLLVGLWSVIVVVRLLLG